MKTYVLYHGNCPDGFAAALAVRLTNPPNPVFVPCNYGKPLCEFLPEPGIDDCVYVVDFSFSREELLELEQRVGRLVVLDHHKTAQEALRDLPFATFDMSRSGAVMAWEYFRKGPPPKFFLYVQDRDLWRWELPRSREFSAALGSYPFEFAVWETLLDRHVTEIMDEGVACLRLKDQQVEIMAKRARMALFDLSREGKPAIAFNRSLVVALKERQWVVPVANATVFFSEVGERMCQLHPDAPFSAYWFEREDGVKQWGLRSRGEFDCSTVAKAFGGGGHPGAAGFQR